MSSNKKNRHRLHKGEKYHYIHLLITLMGKLLKFKSKDIDMCAYICLEVSERVIKKRSIEELRKARKTRE